MSSPSYFLAAIQFGNRASFRSVDSAGYARSFERQSRMTVEKYGLSLELLSSDSVSVAESTSEGIWVAVHGELYARSSKSPAVTCLQAYANRGLAFVGDLHGSFALVIFDRPQGRIWLVTDHVNSRKLFYGEYDGRIWVSTMHSFQLHPCSGQPDPTGIAQCLVSGVPYNGRTPFHGVHVLPRASVHEVTASGVKSELYWHYRPNPAIDAPPGGLDSDFRDALLAAVERRIPSDCGVSLLLSGGYDSTVILGALGSLGVPNVRCFTYLRPWEADQSDATVARHMASIFGYDHQVVRAYCDDVATVIGENVAWGQGMTRLTVETDAWRSLRNQSVFGDDTTMWVGEEYFGMVPGYTLRSVKDVLDSLAMYDLGSLGRLRRVLPTHWASWLQETLREELKSLVGPSLQNEDFYALRDYLYIEHRLQRILSWREAFAEPCGEVRNPLLDREILEFTQRLPRNLRLGKRFLKVAGSNLFPDLFAIGRARGTWFAGMWVRSALEAETDALKSLVRDRSSPLDSILPPDDLVRLIETEAGAARALRRGAARLRKRADRVRRLVKGIGYPASSAGPPKRKRVDPAMFVMRAIVLRELFRSRLGERN